MNRGIAKEMLKLPGSAEDYAIAAKLDPKFAFNPGNVDYNSLAQAKQKANQSAQQNPPNSTPAQTKANPTSQAKTQAQPNNSPTTNQPETAQNNEPKKETKEERDRRRYKLTLSDAGNTPSSKDEIIEDGRIQNKNIAIDLQPIFMLSSSDRNSLDYERSQYYNGELETMNNFNNYNPIITLSNKSTDRLIDISRNQILFFNEKIKSNRKESYNFLSRGVFYSIVNEYSSSMNDFKKAIELNSNNMLAYFALANCKMEMTNKIEQFKQNAVLKNVAIKSELQKNIETTTETFTDYSEVMNNYATCLKLNPKFPFAYFNQAYVKCKIRDYQGALDDLNKAIEIEKDFAEAYFNRGLTKIYLDDIEGGAIDLSKAGELGIQDAYNIIKRYCN